MISIPILYLDNTVLFPGTKLIAKFSDKKSIHVINYCIQNDLPVLILLYPNLGKSYQFGTLSKFHQNDINYSYNHNELRITLEGVSRARVLNIIQHIPYTIGEIEFKHELKGSGTIIDDQLIHFKNMIKKWVYNQTISEKERILFLTSINNHTEIINYSCFLLLKDPEIQQYLLESNSLSERFQLLQNILTEKREQYDQAEFLNALKNFNEIEKSVISH